ncbi:hypothetical protein C8R44DRAFT_677221 [Mycena epipterygia]|nr:hypothetical protein C8R44DRAFT_677221 [Mycena epipterygia]
MKFTTLAIYALIHAAPAALALPFGSITSSLLRRTGHVFTLKNNCPNAIQPVIADTRCGYSPRCANATSYTGPQPSAISAKGSAPVTIPSAWVGRVFANTPACGPKGEHCTVTEFNLDTGSNYTAQNYDISNIQGFTQSVQITSDLCPTHTVTCTNADCGCANAYPIGDMSGCGHDAPVQACGPGDVKFTITFCP